MTYERPILTIDVVLLTIIDGRLSVALMERGDPNEPFFGSRALIGGFVHTDEDATAKDTALRVLKAKGGVEGVYMEQLMTFSGAARDPRGWSASIAYLALAPETALDGCKRKGIGFADASDPGELAFDHDDIVRAAVERLRTKGSYSTLPARLAESEFTLSELQRIYEVATRTSLNPSAFRKKMNDLDILEETGGFRRAASRRPGALWRLKRDIETFDRRI